MSPFSCSNLQGYLLLTSLSLQRQNWIYICSPNVA
jgi:hypothetical protein